MRIREDEELIKFFDWLAWQEKQEPMLRIIHHVANERRASWAAGKRLKRKGVRKGILDVSCPIPRGRYHGLYVELKIRPNKLTEDQVEVMKILHGLGHCVRVAWSGDELIGIVKEYLYGNVGA